MAPLRAGFVALLLRNSQRAKPSAGLFSEGTLWGTFSLTLPGEPSRHDGLANVGPPNSLDLTYPADPPGGRSAVCLPAGSGYSSGTPSPGDRRLAAGESCGSHGFQPDSFRATLRGVFQTNPPGGRFAVCLPAGTGSRLRSSSDTSSSREHPTRARSLPRGGPPGAGPSGGPLRLPSGMRLVVIPPHLQSLRIRPSRARTGLVCLLGSSSLLPTSGTLPPPTSGRIARPSSQALMRRVAGELSEGC